MKNKYLVFGVVSIGLLLINIGTRVDAQGYICDGGYINYGGQSENEICYGSLLDPTTQNITSFSGNYTENYVGYYGSNSNLTINPDINLISTDKFLGQIGYYGTNNNSTINYDVNLASTDQFGGQIGYYGSNSNLTINPDINLISTDKFLGQIGYYGSQMTFSGAIGDMLAQSTFSSPIGYYGSNSNLTINPDINLISVDKFTSKIGNYGTNYNLSFDPNYNLLDSNLFGGAIGYYNDKIRVSKLMVEQIGRNSEKYYLGIPAKQEEVASKDQTGDPVILTTGEFEYEDNMISVGTNIGKINLGFKYNSQNNYTGPLGNNIHFNLIKYLYFDSESVLFVDGYNGSTSYKYDAGAQKFVNLTSGDNSQLLRTLSGGVVSYLVKNNDGLNYGFNNLGQLQYIADSYSNKITYAYKSDGNIDYIDIGNNKTINFTYFDYTYNTPFGNSKNIKTMSISGIGTLNYSYDYNGNLISYEIVKDGEISGDKTTFVYSPSIDSSKLSLYGININMTKIFLPSGEEYLTNIYDSNERVISQKLGSGSLTFDYETNGSGDVVRTTVTDRNGNKSIFSADSKGGIIDKIEGSGGLMTFYDLDINGNTVKEETYYGSKDDLNNAVLVKEIQREFDDKNNLTKESISTEIRNEKYETRRIDHMYASNKLYKTTNYGYDPIFHKLKWIQDDKGNMTINHFDYEEGFNVTQLANKSGLTQEEVIATLSGTTNINLGDLNEDSQTGQINGNVIKTEKYLSGAIGGSNNPYSVELYSYDDKGRLIKDIAPNKTTTTYIFDSGDNLLSKTTTNSGSNITLSDQYTYDDNKNLLTEQSGKDHSENTYDLLGRLIESKSNNTKNTYEYSNNGDVISESAFILHKATGEYIITSKNNYQIDTNGNKTQDETISYSGGVEVKRETVNYTYDGNENLVAQSDDTTPAPILKYDDYNNLILRVTNSGAIDEMRTSYTYDDYGNTKSETTTIGDRTKTTSYEYDKYGQNIKTISNDGSYTTTAYNSDGSTYETKSYDKDDNLLKTQRYEYNEYSQVKKSYVVYGEGSSSQLDSVEYIYDDYGNKIEAKYSNGTNETWSYEPTTGKNLVYKDTNGTIITNTYSNDGTLIKKNTKSGTNIDTTEEYSYDNDGNLIAKIVDGKTLESYVYNDFGQLYQSLDNIVGRIQTTNYSYDGKILSTSDNDKITQLAYDGSGRTSEMSIYDAQNPGVKLYNITYEYDSKGRTTKKNYISTSGNQAKRSIAYEYNKYGEVVKKSNLSNDNIIDYSEITYNNDGRPVETNITSNNPDYFGINKENYSYDSLGRMKDVTVQTTDSKIVKNELVYNIRGNPSSENASINNSLIYNLAYSYTVDGKLNKISTDISDNSLVGDDIVAKNNLEYTYAGQKLSSYTSKGYNKGGVEKYNKNILTLTYSDPFNILSSQKTFGNNLNQYLTYNNKGLTTEDRIADVNRDLYKVNYTYRENGDITNEDINKFDINTQSGVQLSSTYTYDNYDRVSESIFDKDATRTKNTKYSYSVTGNRTRLEEIKTLDSIISSEISNFGTGSETGGSTTSGTGTETNSGSTDTNSGTTSGSGSESGTGTETGSGTTETGTGTESSSGTGTETGSGSETSTGEISGTGGETPNLALPEDNSGTTNPTTQSRIINYSTNDFNAYTNLTEDITYSSGDTIVNGTGNNIVFQYDERGNLREDNKYKYYYDYKNRLTKVTSLDGSLISKYYYNGLGYRIEKDIGTKTILYSYSTLIKGGAISEIHTDNNNLEYVIYYNYDGSNRIINSIKSESSGNNLETYYYQDRLGSTKFITDDSGNIIQSYEYDDYGKIRSIETTTNGGTTILDEISNLLTDRLYAGYIFDSEIDLYFLKNRHYSAELGRFIQTDPIEEGDDVNLYAYTKNNPLNWVDPEGTKSECKKNKINPRKTLVILAIDKNGGPYFSDDCPNNNPYCNPIDDTDNYVSGTLRSLLNGNNPRFDIEIVKNFIEFDNAILKYIRKEIYFIGHGSPDSIDLNSSKILNRTPDEYVSSRNLNSYAKPIKALYNTEMTLLSCDTGSDKIDNPIAQQIQDHYGFKWTQAPTREIDAHFMNEVYSNPGNAIYKTTGWGPWKTTDRGYLKTFY